MNKQFVRRVSADRHYRGRLHISALEKRVVSSDNAVFHRSKHVRVWPRPARPLVFQGSKKETLLKNTL